MIRTILLAICLLAWPALGQSIIELKSSARTAPGATVTLRDVATLTGPDATALAETRIQPSGTTIGIEDVRKALEGKVNWGRVSLRGGVCTLMTSGASREPQTP